MQSFEYDEDFYGDDTIVGEEEVKLQIVEGTD
jgi:hypothetical protein